MTSQLIKDYSHLDVFADASMFQEKRMENDVNGNPVFIGYNKRPNASTTALTWFIVKITYSGTAVTRYQLPDNGVQFKYAWDSRSSYFT